MTCTDCQLTITDEEAAADPRLEVERRCISKTGRCVACEFQRSIDERIRKVKGEVECQTKKD